MKALSYVARRASQRPKSSLSRIVAIDKKNQINFTQVYDDARSACNGCHEESGHRFIQNHSTQRPAGVEPKMEFFRLKNFGLLPTGQIHGRRTSGEHVERS